MAQGIQVPVTQSGLSQSINQAVKQMGTLNVPVNIDPSSFKNLAQPLGKISGLATEFEKSIAASNARVIAFGASVGIINGIQNAFADLVKTGIEVQKTLAEIGAISGKTGKDLSDFGDQIFETARKTGQSFQTASQAALEFSRQGLKSTEETIRRTNDALALTRFTTLSAADAVDGLTAAVNTFSSAGVNTTDILNKLVALDTKYAVSAEDLIKGLARVGSVGQEAGVSLDELGAAITVVQEKTARGGAVIGNAFKTIFTNLRSDTAVQALRDIGVESLDAQGKLKDAIPLLQELAVKIQGLSGGEKIQILESVASKYNINILSALLDDLGKKQSQFNKAVQDSSGAGATAYARLAALNEALSSQINTATVSVTQLFNKLSEIGVTENLSNLLKFVNGLLDGFNKLLDSEGIGGNIAKGLIKGLSDIFFSVGLPILAAIFIKLTKDIAQFGVESLKTILGINQQVRERQALEQAVVNTLIRDQEVMANILALSGDRAKQEQYLLGIYNAQINALQQVQTIAATVTPGLIGAGLSATSGTVKKRAAGGYLPAQEAADVRRGVGGASPSSSVVAIPNFAFGGGKRGTMIANTSEYVVPNFANGGSAIFNQDMVKAYGLPSGAKKISAAGGYIPNFAEGDYSDYAALVGRKSNGKLSRENRWVSIDQDGKVKVVAADRRALGGENGKLVSFDVYGVPASSEREIEGIKRDLGESGKEQAVRLAQQITGNTLPSDLITGKLSATFNPGSLASFAGTIFEASVGSMLGDKSFKDYSEQSVTSAFDLNIAGNQKIKDAFGIESKVSALEIKGDYTKGLMDSVAKKIYQVTEGQRAAFSKTKIGNEQAKALGVSRPITNLSTLEVTETIGGKQQTTKFGSQQEIENYLSTKYTKGFGSSTVAGTGRFSKNGSRGYIPNFANGGPLKDAVNREMAAGLDPSQIRVTTDGRLKNSSNPAGLAVINTRDEPDGKVPNFAIRAPTGATNAAGQNIGGQFVSANPSGYSSPIGPQPLEQSSEKAAIGLDKMFYAMSGVTLAVNSLKESLGKTESAASNFVSSLAQGAQSASQGALLGSFAGPVGQIAGGVIGGVYGYGKSMLEWANRPLEQQQESMAKGRETALSSSVTSPEEQLKITKSQIGYEQNLLGRQGLAAQAITEDNSKWVENLVLGKTTIAELIIAYRERNSIDQDFAKTDAQILLLKKKEQELEGIVAQRAEERLRIEREASANAERRVAIAREINKIELSFTKGRASDIESQAKKRAELSAGLPGASESDKDKINLNIKLQDLEDKRKQGLADIGLRAFQELKTASSLATVKESELETLKNRIANGETLENIEADLNKLGIQGARDAKVILDTLAKRVAETNILSKAEREALKTTNDSEIAQRNLNKQLQARLDIINNSISAEIELNNLKIKGSQQFAAEAIKVPRTQLQNQISRQPFATRAQEADLAKINLEIEEFNQRSAIANTFNNNVSASADERTNAYKNQTKALSQLSDAERGQYLQAIKDKDFEKAKGFESKLTGDVRLEFIDQLNNADQKYSITIDQQAKLMKVSIENLQELYNWQFKISQLKKTSPISAGITIAMGEISKEAEDFPVVFANNTTLAFRDGLKEAMTSAISQTDNLGDALQNVALNFLKTMQSQFLTQASGNITLGIGKALGLAQGGPVTGGSGYKDDVPAMLTGGEFVMRKSAVQKYGVNNLRKMNDGGIFLPGVRGGASISGYDDLKKFANQTTTSGATDVLKGGGSSAFIDLEDQSSKLSRWALMNNDTINQEIRSAQEQGLGLISQREAYRTQQRKAMQQQIVGTLASAAISFGAGALRGAGAAGAAGKAASGAAAGSTGYGLMQTPKFLAGAEPFKMPFAYGGSVRGFSSGGSPTDNISAMLMDGEYVMSAGTSKKYGKKFLDSMNNGSRPRFAAGGDVGDALDVSASPSKEKAAVAGDVSIVINVTGGTSDTQAQGKTDQGGIDYKKMSEKIKVIVLETITEEKRLGGSLRR